MRTAVVIPGRSGSFPLMHSTIAKIIIAKIQIKIVLDNVLISRLTPRGKRRIWNVKLIAITDIFNNIACIELNLRKYGIWGFLVMNKKIRVNIRKLPKGMTLSNK